VTTRVHILFKMTHSYSKIVQRRLIKNILWWSKYYRKS